MSTQQTTTSQQNSGLQFDPSSLGTYQGLTRSGGNVLNQYMNNPLSNPFYNLGQSQSQRGALQLGQNNMSALANIMQNSGLGGQAGAGWLAAQRAQTGRANQGMRSQANLANIMSAFNRQIGATGLGMSFSPLVTGQNSSGTQTTSTGGLGTWLPQLAGAAIGAASMGMMGGGGGGGMFSAMSGGAPTAVPGVTGAVGPMSGMSGGLGSVMSNPLMSAAPSMPTLNPAMFSGMAY